MSSRSSSRLLLKPYVPIRQTRTPDCSTSPALHPIQISPEQVIFSDIVTPYAYVSTVSIRNLTSQARRVKIFHNPHKNFTIKYDIKASCIAPGLCLIITISLETKNLTKGTHQFNVVTEGYKKTIRIVAHKPQLLLECPQYVNFGTIEYGSAIRKEVQFVNRSKGKMSLAFEMKEKSGIRIVPQKIQLKESQKGTALVQYKPEKVGVLNGLLYVNVAQDSNSNKLIPLKGAAIKSSHMFVDADGLETNKISFKDMYLGQKSSKTFRFVNNTAKSINLRIVSIGIHRCMLMQKSHQLIPDAFDVLSPQKYAKQQRERFLNCDPKQAQVASFTEVPLVLTAFKIPSADQIKEFQNNMTSKGFKSIVEPIKDTCILKIQINADSMNAETLEIPVQSKLYMPFLSLSQECFDFALMAELKKTTTMRFELRNHQNMPITVAFEFQQHSHFSIQGGNVHHLEGLTTKSLQMAHTPRSFGVHSQTVTLRVLKYYQFTIRLYGQTKRLERVKSQSLKFETDKQNIINCNDKIGANKIFNKTGGVLSLARQMRQRNRVMSLVKKKLLEKMSKQEPTDLCFQAGILTAPPSPKIKVPYYNESLYVDNTFKQGQTKRFAPKSHLASPRNKQQETQIYRQLSIQELKSIIVSKTTINFGTMFVKSVVKQSFMVKNNTAQSIQVQILCGDPRLEVLDSNRQVIPSGQCATFQLTLQSKYQGDFSSITKYIINNRHQFQFLVTANFIAVTLQPSHTHISLNIDEYDVCFSKSETFKLFNNGNISAKFQFANLPMFEVKPSQGEIPPQSSMEINVFYTPVCQTNQNCRGTRVDEDKLYYTVLGGTDSYIRCTGSVKYTKCLVKQTEINLGQVPFCTQIKTKITVRNTSRSATAFKIQLSPKTLSNYVSIEQQISNIAAEQKQQVYFKFFCQADKLVKGEILCHIRGYKKFVIPFTAKSTVPKLSIVEECLDFGKVVCLGRPSLPFKIRNDSAVDGVAKVVGFCPFLGAITIRAEGDKHTYVKLNAKPLIPTLDTTTMSASSSRQENPRSKSHTQQTFQQVSNTDSYPDYTITIPAKTQLPLKLTITPKSTGNFQYMLPITMLNYNDQVDGLTRSVLFTVVEPILTVSEEVVDFKRCVVSDKDQYKPVVVELGNPANVPMRWEIKTFEAKSPFRVIPEDGEIAEKSSVKLMVYFRPQIQGDYEVDYHMKISRCDHPADYVTMYLKVIGQGVNPALFFDRRQIILGAIPLNITTKLTFVILNDGYENVSIDKWKLQQQFDNVQINIDFHQGRTLSVIKQRLNVNITFKAKQPISFTTMLHIFDSNSLKFSVPVSATADNCVLTSYNYLETSEGEYQIVQENGLHLREIENESSEPRQVQVYNCSTLRRDLQFNFFKLPRPQTTKRTCKFILQWFKYYVSQKVQYFPQTCMQEKGEPIFQMLSKMTTTQFKDSNAKPVEGPDRVKRLHTQYSFMIRKLKEEGCLLNHIRPQYLFSIEDYLQFIGESEHRHSISSSQILLYEQVCCQSWAIIFFQICKVFILSKVTNKNLKNLLSKFSQPRKQLIDKIKQSNIYSQYQLRLIYFLNDFTGQHLISFGDICPRNKYFSTLVDRIVGMEVGCRLYPIRSKDCRFEPDKKNWKNIYKMLNDFGLSLFIAHSQLTILCAKQMLLFFVHLVQVLDQYTPRQKVLFNCELGQKKIKLVELRNPSDKQITYWPKIVGSEDFRIDDKDPIVLTPYQIKQFPVECYCKYSKSTTAKLFFIERATENESFARAAPFVIELYRQIGRKSISKFFQFHACQFELVNIPIEVITPFNLQEGTILDLDISLLEDQSKKKPQYFFLPNNTFRLVQGKLQTLQIKFLSLQQQNRVCRLSFFEQSVGQFVFEIKVKVHEPYPTQSLRLNPIISTQNKVVRIDLPTLNKQLNIARRTYAELTKTRMKEFPVQPVFSCELINKTDQVQVSEQVTLDVINQVTMFQLAITLKFTKAYKSFVFQVLMKNGCGDARVYEFTIQVNPKPIVIHMNMQCSARTEIMQTIPIKLLPSKINLDSPSQQLYIHTQLRQFNASCQSHKAILVFRPSWICQFNATFLIENTQTSEKIFYKIKATATEPHPQQTLQIVMKNRTKASRSIEVKFSLGENMKIFCSLPFCNVTRRVPVQPTRNFLSPQKAQQLIGMLGTTFDVDITPQNVGSFDGVIRLINSINGQYVWYRMRISVMNTDSSGQIKVTGPPAVITKFVTPPFKDSVGKYYQVTLDAPFVTGKNTFTVDSAFSKFQMQYCPLKEINYTGKVSFVDTLSNSEIWYVLKLSVEKLPTVVIPLVQAEIGGSKALTIPVNNPSDLEVRYKILNSNPEVFQTEQTLTIEPRQQALLTVMCCPSILSEIITGKLVLKSENLYTRQYNLSTLGVPQDEIQHLNFIAATGERAEQAILFRNFMQQECLLKFQFSNRGFGLETKDGYCEKPKNIIQGKDPVKFIIIFAPTERKSYQSVLTITVNDKFKWKYYLSGKVVQQLPKSSNMMFSTKCRQSITRTIVFDGLGESIVERMEIKDYENVLQSKFLSQENGRLQVVMTFVSFKPIQKTNIPAQLICQNGFSWNFNISLEVLRPDPDDTLYLESSLNNTTKVSFRLTNKTKSEVPYEAYIAEQSDACFDIQPRKGILDGFGSNVTIFYVTFLPTEHHFTYNGLLLVETEEMVWTFRLLGRLPKYYPPKKENLIATMIK